MRTIYEAYDGTQFNTPEDCFDYEWREKFPNIRLFDIDGTALSSISDAEMSYIAKVNNADEKKFVCDYMRICYGDIGFYDYWQNIHNGPSGYIMDTENDMCYISASSLIEYYQGELDSESALAINLTEEKA